MKHHIILVTSVVAVGAALAVAVHANHNAVHSTKTQAVKVSQQIKQAVSKERIAVRNLKEANEQKSKAQSGCETGVKDYQLLTPAQRAHATLPVCE